MRYYTCQVRYQQMGEVKSVLHTEYAESARVAAQSIADQIDLCKPLVLALNDHKDFLVVRSEDILNVAVVRGE